MLENLNSLQRYLFLAQVSQIFRRLAGHPRGWWWLLRGPSELVLVGMLTAGLLCLTDIPPSSSLSGRVLVMVAEAQESKVPAHCKPLLPSGLRASISPLAKGQAGHLPTCRGKTLKLYGQGRGFQEGQELGSPLLHSVSQGHITKEFLCLSHWLPQHILWETLE